MTAPIVFFDLETGGVEDDHADIQVAAIAVVGWREVAAFEAKIVFDERRADPEALRINHYDSEVWKREAKPEGVVVAALADFLRRYASIEKTSARTGRPYRVARLAGHNVSRFDGARLMRMFKRNDQFLPAETYLPLDTLQLALWRCAMRGDRPASFKLGDLCDYFGVDVEHAHDALADVRACLALTMKLLNRQPQEAAA